MLIVNQYKELERKYYEKVIDTQVFKALVTLLNEVLNPVVMAQQDSQILERVESGLKAIKGNTQQIQKEIIEFIGQLRNDRNKQNLVQAYMNVQMRRANLELATCTDESNVAYLLAGLE